MVQSLNLGAAQNSQAPSTIRRINRLPIIVIVVLAVTFLGVIFYGLASRGLYFGEDTGPETSSGNPASTFADQIKRGVTDGIIGEPQQQTTFQPTPIETKQVDEKSSKPFTPQPGATRGAAARSGARSGSRMACTSSARTTGTGSAGAAAPAHGPLAGEQRCL